MDLNSLSVGLLFGTHYTDNGTDICELASAFTATANSTVVIVRWLNCARGNADGCDVLSARDFDARFNVCTLTDEQIAAGITRRTSCDIPRADLPVSS